MSVSSESSRLRGALEERVLGQSEAVQAIVDGYVRWKAGLAGLDKPVATFLMLGPTGVGKTLTVESLAEVLHGDARMLIKIHCAEYRHSHEIARLVGAPPGYIGHKETQPRLSQRKIQEAQSKGCPLVILLFDEIEKAHPDLWDLLLGVLDKGDLHLGDGSSADLRQSMVFLTSNVGAREASGAIGYRPERSQKAESAARRLFSPEFRNRLTAQLTYRPLNDQQVRCITDLELRRCSTRVRQTRGVGLAFRDSVASCVLEECQDSTSPRQGSLPQAFAASTVIALDSPASSSGILTTFGARPIRRTIERLLELPLAHMILDGRIGPGDEIEVGGKNRALTFHRRRAA
jgi:ATP-dependent Clp protease ATP-binding subunit ClpA